MDCVTPTTSILTPSNLLYIHLYIYLYIFLYSISHVLYPISYIYPIYISYILYPILYPISYMCCIIWCISHACYVPFIYLVYVCYVPFIYLVYMRILCTYHMVIAGSPNHHMSCPLEFDVHTYRTYRTYVPLDSPRPLQNPAPDLICVIGLNLSWKSSVWFLLVLLF